MLDFDDIVTKEMYFDNQFIEDTAEESFNSLLHWIVGALIAGKDKKAIKKHILAQEVDVNLKENILKTIKQQQRIILGKDKGFSLEQEGLAGLTFSEAIEERNVAIRKRAIKFMARSKEMLKTQQTLEKFVREEVQRYIKNTESFWQTQTKAAREHSYAAQDKRYDGIKGWMSVAILDSKTSPVCVKLHNNFYPIKNYANRSDVPDKPPRHPNCRSILLTVRGGIDIAEYKGQNIEVFMKRNPKVAEDIMGKKKYKMWAEGNEKINRYIDMKGRRFYTNEEIIRKLDIRP